MNGTKKRSLRWNEEVDDNGLPQWTAASRFHDEGSRFEHRIIKLLAGYSFQCDQEVRHDQAAPCATLDEAKARCQAIENIE